MEMLLIIVGLALAAFALPVLFVPGFRAKLQGYKTMLFNGLIGLGSVGIAITDYLKTVDLGQFLTPGRVAVVGIVVAGLGAFLRFVTTTPMGKKY